MKKILWFITASLLLTTFTACEQGLQLTPDFEDSVAELRTSELPAEVLAEVNNLYPNETIESALQVTASDMTSLIALTLSNDKEMTFLHNGRRCNDTIAIDSLPAAIQTYVDNNYPGEMILKAVVVTKPDGSTVIVIHISSGEILAFDQSGTFLGERPRRHRRYHGSRDNHASIDPADLPAAVLTALSTDYPGATVEKAIELTRRDESVIYLLKLDDGTHVAYDADGNELEDFRPSWRQARRFCQGNPGSSNG